MKNYRTRGVVTAMMAFLVSGLLSSQFVVEEQLSPRITGYRLDVSLDDKAGLVTGAIDAFWVNTSPYPATEARMHMYMNAFRSNRTTFSGVAGIKPHKSKDEYGWIDFLTATDGSGNSLLDAMEYIAPDDGNQYDKTVLLIDLPQAVMPGDTLRIKGTFETKLPSNIRRTGYKKDFFFVAQWFPKFGVWQPDSDTSWAWNCHQFHQTSEFYSNHSVYDVTITLPEKYIVGTGGLIQKEESLPDGMKRQTWRAEDIVDFAWTAWPHYKVYHDRWNHVAITLLIPQGRKSQVARHMGAVRNTLEFMTENLGPYPWPHVTVVDPPMIGQGSGGMEYTTLFTSSGMDFVPRWAHIPEMVTAHELGHAWFMGILATNEFEEPWLDEGINSFFEQRILDRYYGEGNGMFNHRLLKISDRSFGRLQYVLSGVKQVADNTMYSWQFPQGSYGMMSYSKAALWLQSLMGIVGEETINAIFREYYKRWSFGHPTAEDFIEVVNDVVPLYHGDKFGDDMNWFFDQTLFSSGICDYKVHQFYQSRVYSYSGVERENDSTFVVKSDTLREVMTYRSVVNLQRTGEVIMPVEVRVGLSNGEEITMMWDGRDRYKDLIFEYEEDIKVQWVRLDPDFKNPLDVNVRNNSLTTTPDNKPLIRFARKVTFLIQMIFNFIMI